MRRHLTSNSLPSADIDRITVKENIAIGSKVLSMQVSGDVWGRGTDLLKVRILAGLVTEAGEIDKESLTINLLAVISDQVENGQD